MTKQKKIGNVKQLFISIKKGQRRTPKTNILVDKKGIPEDKFYDKNPDRSVLITSIFAYDLMKKQDIEVIFGQLGENILVDFDPSSLKEGTKISIGDAIFTITQECTICDSLKNIDAKVPKLLKHNRGIFAKVITSGNLNINDEVSIIN